MNEQKPLSKIIANPNTPQLTRKEFNANNIFVEGKLLETELGELRKKRDGAKLRLAAAREEAEKRLTALDFKLEENRKGGNYWAGEAFLYGDEYYGPPHHRLELLGDCDYQKSPWDFTERELMLKYGEYDHDRRGERPFISLSDKEIAQRLRDVGIRDIPQESLKNLMVLATEAYNAIETARAILIEKNELDLEILSRTDVAYRVYREKMLRLKARLG